MDSEPVPGPVRVHNQFQDQCGFIISSRTVMGSGEVADPMWIQDPIQDRYGLTVSSKTDTGSASVPEQT